MVEKKVGSRIPPVRVERETKTMNANALNPGRGLKNWLEQKSPEKGPPEE